MPNPTPKPWNYLRMSLRTRGISPAECAQFVGVSEAAVRRWISGYSNPRVQQFILLAELLNVRLDKLIYRCPMLVDPENAEEHERYGVPTLPEHRNGKTPAAR